MIHSPRQPIPARPGARSTAASQAPRHWRRLVAAASIGLAAFVGPVLAQPVEAEGQHRWTLDGHVVQANAMRTDFLGVDVARKLGIERSNERGMLTISVQEKSDEPLPESVKADVRVAASMGANSRWTIDMQPRRADGVVYYVGTFPIRHRQLVEFDVQIQPAGVEDTRALSFKRVFMTD